MKSIDPLTWLRNELESEGNDLLRSLVAEFAEKLMSAEADARCGAAYGSRVPERTNHRNGYRERRWDTRVGTIDLAIPKLRTGSYFPHWLLEPRRRGEKALVAVICEAYVQGISTRNVDHLVQALGLDGLSKSQVSELAKNLDETVEAFRNRPLDATAYPYVWLDALVHKSRENGHVVNVATVIATAVSHEGHREVLGVDVITVEDRAGWLAFLRNLVQRGLRGVRLVISDAHSGLVDAIATALPGAAWQRCRTHFMRNLLAKVPKSAQKLVGALVRSIFAQTDADAVWAQHAAVVNQLTATFPDAARLLDQARDDILAFRLFPVVHWSQIWSNNPLERLNKEIRRRTDVVGIFPNRDAIIRLVGALLAEQHDEWAVARRYMSADSLVLIPQPPPPALAPKILDPPKEVPTLDDPA